MPDARKTFGAEAPTLPSDGEVAASGKTAASPKLRTIFLCAICLGIGVLIGLPQGQSARAVASWYGPGLYGNRTACGHRLTPGSMWVAHKTLRCGTRLTICFRGRCRRSYVGDRGPYIAGRQFDLAAGLARSLRFSGVQAIGWWRL